MKNRIVECRVRLQVPSTLTSADAQRLLADAIDRSAAEHEREFGASMTRDSSRIDVREVEGGRPGSADDLEDRRVEMSLVGVDGNAFSVLGEFQRHAIRQGWTDEEIESVVREAKSGDYEHLLSTIVSNIRDPEGDDVMLLGNHDPDNALSPSSPSMG